MRNLLMWAFVFFYFPSAFALDCERILFAPSEGKALEDSDQKWPLLLSCYFQLGMSSEENESSSRLAALAAAKIAALTYPNELSASSSALSQKIVLAAAGHNLAEFENEFFREKDKQAQAEGLDSELVLKMREQQHALLKADLLDVLEARYSAVFLENNKAWIQEKKMEALQRAQQSGVSAGALTFVSAYLFQRSRSVHSGRLLATLATAASALGASMWQHSVAQKEWAPEGYPRPPSEILGEATADWGEILDPQKSGTFPLFISSVMAFVLFPAVEKPLRSVLWEPLKKTLRPLSKNSVLQKPLSCWRSLHKVATSSWPKLSSTAGSVANLLLHPVNFGAALISFNLSEKSLEMGRFFQAQKRLELALHRLAVEELEPFRKRLALAEVERCMRVLGDLLKEKAWVEMFSSSQGQDRKDFLQKGRGLTLALKARREQGEQNAEALMSPLLHALEQKKLKDVEWPAELGLWVALQVQKLGLKDLGRMTYYADREALMLEIYLDSHFFTLNSSPEKVVQNLFQ